MTAIDEMTPFKIAERALHLQRGAILRQGAGVYWIERGSYRRDFPSLEEAYEAGMALEPIKPPSGRRKRPLSMRPKAVSKRRRRGHWRKMVARINRGGLA